MPKILVFSDKKADVKDIVTPLKNIGYIVSHVSDKKFLFEEAAKFLPDIAILDVDAQVDEVSKICRKVRLTDSNSDMQILLLLNQNLQIADISQAADGYIPRPIDSSVLVSVVNAHLRLKGRLDIFAANNSELAQRFYQLNVLYDTNSRLAGTLSPKKLINIMHEGLEQSVSYSICMTLLINNPNDVQLIINSTYPLSRRLEQALKLRTVMAYKSLFQNNTKMPFEFDVNDVKTQITYKKDDEVFDFDIMRCASIFSPISTQDKFFGSVEILRDEELSNEDTTCFQTVVSQVALPLESAILYEEIREKNAKLEKLEKLKSEFVSIVSHELRTPLTAIKNSLDIILSGKTGNITDKMSNFLNMGKRNVTRLSGIINDLLDLSKIEAGKMEYRFEKTNLVEPINMVAATFSALADEKGIKLNVVSKVDEAYVYADSQKIEQVLTNLVSNALKFTDTKGKVSIILSQPNKHSAEYQVEVKDTGIGISEENVSKVFDKFQQIESSLSRKVGGTGLGLPIAKEFVVVHRGNIMVESKEGKGTSFIFTLPKFDEYSNFLTELALFYEKSKNAKTNFGCIKIKTNDTNALTDYFKQDTKYRKIFVKDDVVYVITQNLNKNLYEIYLEKLKDFASQEKNAKMSISDVYCDFGEDTQLSDMVAEIENS